VAATAVRIKNKGFANGVAKGGGGGVFIIMRKEIMRTSTA
jgi:hypothetical protein